MKRGFLWAFGCWGLVFFPALAETYSDFPISQISQSETAYPPLMQGAPMVPEPISDVAAPGPWSMGIASSAGSDSTWGGMLNLGCALSGNLGLRIFGGARFNETSSRPLFHIGGDIEIQPFNAWEREYRTLELSVLVGGSTLDPNRELLHVLHGGLRTNLRIVSGFNLTVAAHAGLSQLTGEAGILLKL